MIKIFISGASGFVGQNLKLYLTNNNFTYSLLSRGDLNDMKSLDQNADVVVHLAGKAHDLKKSSNPNEYYKINFELTKRLYDAFLASSASKFIFISSIKAVADSTQSLLTEDQIPNPKNHYGKSKLMAEDYIKSQVLPNGKSFYILRPCMIHGPGNKGNLNLLYNFIAKGIPYPLAAFENKRSYLSVQNLCFVIKELISRKNLPSNVFHLADDDALSTKEVVSVLSASIGKKAKLWHIPKGFVRLIALIGDRLNLPLNTERLNKMTESYTVNNKKIKEVLGAEFPLSTREGLEITARSFNINK